MSHALILDDNMLIGRAVQQRLASLGFDSFDWAWTEERACEAANFHSPDLLVVGKNIVGGSALSAAERISTARNVPILTISADYCQVERRQREGAPVTAQFHLTDIESAVVAALIHDTEEFSGGRTRVRTQLACGCESWLIQGFC